MTMVDHRSGLDQPRTTPERDTPVRVGYLGGTGLVRHGLESCLEREGWGAAQLVDVDVSAPDDVDVVLVDLQFCGPWAVDRIQQLVALGYSPVLACGWAPTAEARSRLVSAGAAGYLSWQIRGIDLIATLRHVSGNPGSLRPRDPLDRPDLAGCTAREGEILTLICHGLSNQEIAEELYLSINTVKSYIRGAYRKIGVTTRPHAVAWGIRHGCLR